YSSALLATTRARPSARSQTQAAAFWFRSKLNNKELDVSIKEDPAVGRPWRGFCGGAFGGNHSQLRKLATAPRMPHTHAAKQANSRRSLRRKGMRLPPLYLPCAAPS